MRRTRRTSSANSPRTSRVTTTSRCSRAVRATARARRPSGRRASRSYGCGRRRSIARPSSAASPTTRPSPRPRSLRVCRLPRPDLVVAMTDPPVVGLVGLVAAKRYRCPLVQISHDVYPDIAVALGRVHSRFAVRLWRRMNREVRTAAASIIVVGRDMRERLVAESVDPAKIVVIPDLGLSAAAGCRHARGDAPVDELGRRVRRHARRQRRSRTEPRRPARRGARVARGRRDRARHSRRRRGEAGPAGARGT